MIFISTISTTIFYLMKEWAIGCRWQQAPPPTTQLPDCGWSCSKRSEFAGEWKSERSHSAIPPPPDRGGGCREAPCGSAAGQTPCTSTPPLQTETAPGGALCCTGVPPHSVGGPLPAAAAVQMVPSPGAGQCSSLSPSTAPRPGAKPGRPHPPAGGQTREQSVCGDRRNCGGWSPGRCRVRGRPGGGSGRQDLIQSQW